MTCTDKASNGSARYGVATVSRINSIIGLFCRISSLLQGSFAKETYNFKEPTNRSHSICGCKVGMEEDDGAVDGEG